MEKEVNDDEQSDVPMTTFKGCTSKLCRRIQQILESNVDLVAWNSDYTELPEFFGKTILFSDFSLEGKGWAGEISLEADEFENPYLKEGEPSAKLEILKIVSNYEGRVLKRSWKALTEYLNRLNGELPWGGSSFFHKNPEGDQVWLISSFVKPQGKITNQEIFYLLAAHKSISHEFCPQIDRFIQGN
jgi:hypothetical protein